jgi:gamma-glutamyl hercynylcysteine S-oxide synthase
LYDSAAVPHARRWHLPLPSREGTLDYMQRVLDRVLSFLGPNEPDGDEAYFHLLPLFHEDMHDEAFVYTRQTLGYPPPPVGEGPNGRGPGGTPGPWPGDVEVPGGTYRLGAESGSVFVFDNEKWAHPVEVRPFRMARAPVTNAEFRRFVADGGYTRREFWSEPGWAWREQAGAACPVYWRRVPGGWERRHYDRWMPLEDHLPVLHVCWYEAEAYCRWARRRLPTEAEWELAASAEPAPGGRGIGPRRRRYPWGDTAPTPARANLDLTHAGPVAVNSCPEGDSAFGCRQMVGNVWEWTADDFRPYPGFRADPYQEYSAPWFGTHKVLRGGAFTTRGRMITNVYRNFYTPDRRDVLAGFRTCGL